MGKNTKNKMFVWIAMAGVCPSTKYVDRYTGDNIHLFIQNDLVFALRDNYLSNIDKYTYHPNFGNWSFAFGHLEEDKLSMVSGFFRNGTIMKNCDIEWFGYKHNDSWIQEYTTSDW